ncbi:heparinase II/III family protein [Pelagibacterium montanilacus]|uniref:heparinase II/III family protein n=1 Tax=Pelagibacterium montanilacus TaxID=2185280 RepID=UPI000F8C512F|nr:heparinase II/III family protein [Pelagibacterium montanilacus]
MLDLWRYVVKKGAFVAADRVVTSPLFSWTWSGSDAPSFVGRLTEFRPTDSHSVIEMMDGKYLLAGHLVDTGGASPFSVDTDARNWLDHLHGFAWLRHFRELSDPGQRRFARTLVLDWLGRHGDFERETWAVPIASKRVLNWLKNHTLLVEGATTDEVRAINRSLGTQIQSIKARVELACEPFDRLMARIALLGASMCLATEEAEVPGLVAQLEAELARQTDEDGLHLSRNPYFQLQALGELIPVNRLLGLRQPEHVREIAASVERMHRAFERLVLGTREPVYMNGCGQVPVGMVLSVLAQSSARTDQSVISSGYGVLVDGEGRVVADGGKVPPLAHSGTAHAGALSFEYSCGGSFIVGNCGPAPSQLPESHTLFRHGSAHCAPTIDDLSAAELGGGLFIADRLRPRSADPTLSLDRSDNVLEMRTAGYAERYGLDLVRRLTLMGGGHTLAGQDFFVANGDTAKIPGAFSIRFHLGPGVAPEIDPAAALIRMRHRNGEQWSFLWEGAEARIEESVRHSAYYGLMRTFQIVLSGVAAPGAEAAWVITRQ